MQLFSVTAVRLGLVFCLMALPAASFADGGSAMEKVKRLAAEPAVSRDGASNSFTVSKTANDEKLEKAFLKQKAEFTYVIKLLALDDSYTDYKEVAVYTGAGAIPAGERSVTISLDKYVNELKPKLLSTGSVDFRVSTAKDVDYYTAEEGNSISVANDGYRENLIKDAQSNPDMMSSLAEDYQKFVMEHHDLPPERINREFIKKYPQYKSVMPQE